MRLGPELADWPRYLSFVTRILPDGLGDLADPSIKYPSMEAAIASAKYQKASKRPELGAQLFRVEGVFTRNLRKTVKLQTVMPHSFARRMMRKRPTHVYLQERPR
jgi:hypothetical protein